MENVAVKNQAAAQLPAHAPKVGSGADKELFAAFVVNVGTTEPVDAKPQAPAEAPAKADAKAEVKPESREKPAQEKATPVKDAAPAEKPEEAPAPKAEAPKAETKTKQAAPAKDAACQAPAAEEGDVDVIVDVAVDVDAASAELVVKAEGDIAVADEVTVTKDSNENEAVPDRMWLVPMTTEPPVKNEVQLAVNVAPVQEKVDEEEEKDPAQLLLEQLAPKKNNAAPATAGDKAAPQASADVNASADVAAEAAAAADSVADEVVQDVAPKAPHALAQGSKEAHALQTNNAVQTNTAQPAVQNPAAPAAAAQAAAQVKTTAPSGATNSQANADIALRPGLLAQTQESGRAQNARLARLPAQALTQVQEQIAIRLRYGAKAGEKIINIKLSPEDLGRVDVRLEFKEGNQVTAKITADNQFTLDLLQRDSKALERALSDAGLQLDSNSLSFELNQGGSRGFDLARERMQDGGWSSEWKSAAPSEHELDLVVAANTNGISADGRVNIVI